MYYIIMDDSYGDIRIFLLNQYNEKTWKTIKRLFKRHTLLAVVPSSGGFINKEGGWLMDKGDLIDQTHLSYYGFDDDEEWEQYERDMMSFIEEYVVE